MKNRNIKKYLTNEKLSITEDAKNYKSGDPINIGFKFYKKNEQIEEDNPKADLVEVAIVNNEKIKYDFTIKELASKIDMKLEDIEYVEAFAHIDSNKDGDVDFGENIRVFFKPVDEVDVIVLVPGTTDPFNSSISSTKQSISVTENIPLSHCRMVDKNGNEIINYWNDDFVRAINKIKSKKDSVRIVNLHQWSGDNTMEARKNAGIYLIDRLTTTNDKEKAYLPKIYKDINVNFHFIGHSHGGNVINEATQAIEHNSSWSQNWKVKTITYLSTPFFNTIHQVSTNPSIYHEKAEILHLHNDLDLTQRVIANFSLYQLGDILNKVDTTNLQEHLKRFSAQIGDVSNISVINDNPKANTDATTFFAAALFLSARIFMPIYLIIVGTIEYVIKSIKKVRYRTKEDAQEIYMEYIRLLNHEHFSLANWDKENNQNKAYEIRNKDGKIEQVAPTSLIKVLDVFKDVIQEYGKEIEFNVQSTSSHFEKRKRTVINKDAINAINTFISNLSGSINGLADILFDATDKIEDILKDDRYDMLFLIEDVINSKFIDTFLDFIKIDENNLNNQTTFWYIVAEILSHNIEKYDDTYVKPNKQFEKCFLKNKITAVNITNSDPKINTGYGYEYKEICHNFMNDLNILEKRVYEDGSNEANKPALVDMLLELLSNEDMVYENIIFNHIDSFLGSLVINKIKDYANDYGKNLETDEKIEKIRVQLTNFKKSFEKRRNEIVELRNGQRYSGIRKSTIKDLYYLAYNSHNLSKDSLFPEVISFLEKNTYTNRG